MSSSSSSSSMLATLQSCHLHHHPCHPRRHLHPCWQLSKAVISIITHVILVVIFIHVGNSPKLSSPSSPMSSSSSSSSMLATLQSCHLHHHPCHPRRHLHP